MDFWKVYIKDYIFTTPSNICDRAFYENNEVLFSHFFHIQEIATLARLVAIGWK